MGSVVSGRIKIRGDKGVVGLVDGDGGEGGVAVAGVVGCIWGQDRSGDRKGGRGVWGRSGVEDG